MAGTFRVLTYNLQSRDFAGNQVSIAQNTIVQVGINNILPDWVILRDGNGLMALVRQAAVGHITEPIFMIGGQAYAPNGFTANFMADYTVDLDPEEFSIANDVLVCDSRSLGLNIAAGSRVTPVAYSNDGFYWFQTVDGHVFLVDSRHPGAFARAAPEMNANNHNQHQGTITKDNAPAEPEANNPNQHQGTIATDNAPAALEANNPNQHQGTITTDNAPAEVEAHTAGVSGADEIVQSIETAEGGDQAHEDDAQQTQAPTEVEDPIGERQSEPVNNGSPPSAPPEQDLDGQNVMDNMETPELGQADNEAPEAPIDWTQNNIELAMWSPAALMANGISEETLDDMARTVQLLPMVHENMVDPKNGCMLCLLFHDYGQCPFMRFGR